jgi:hypothetical protein
MRRSSAIAHVGLGMWFCRAMEIDDQELIFSSTRKAKGIIIDKRYNCLPDVLVKLAEYNHSLES